MALNKIPRDKIPWYPTIDEEKCIGCGECFEFCKNGVFKWDEENNRPKVAAPFNCVIGCSACMNLCSQESISFPNLKEIREIVQRYYQESYKE